MNRDFVPAANVIADGTEGAREVIECATKRIRVLRRPNRCRLDFQLQERCKERARLGRELHDTLLQGFLGASMLLHEVVRQTPADSPSKVLLSRALYLVEQAIEEGRATLQGLCRVEAGSTSLEQALSAIQDQFMPATGTQFRILVTGKPKLLESAIQKQVLATVREAVVNALHHSKATKIEIQIEYLRHQMRVSVRDNGCGIDMQLIQSRGDLHWGLQGMRDRAADIGAQLRIWSKPGAGTEVELSLPVDAGAENTL
jgi:signal transduction histidine kinase